MLSLRRVRDKHLRPYHLHGTHIGDIVTQILTLLAIVLSLASFIYGFKAVDPERHISETTVIGVCIYSVALIVGYIWNEVFHAIQPIHEKDEAVVTWVLIVCYGLGSMPIWLACTPFMS